MKLKLREERGFHGAEYITRSACIDPTFNSRGIQQPKEVVRQQCVAFYSDDHEIGGDYQTGGCRINEYGSVWCGQADDNVAGLGQIFCLERLRCVKHAEVLLGDTAIGVNGTKCKKVIAVRCGLSGLFAR